MSQWDVHHQWGKEWLPAAPDWDMGDHFTGTIKNAFMPPGLWSGVLPGFIVAPAATHILCSYAGDGTTQGDMKACRRRHHVLPPPDCVPGCNLDYQPIWCPPSLCNEVQCTSPPLPTKYISIDSVSQPGRTFTSDCAWPASSLKWMLKQQQVRNRAYNEVVFDGEAVVRSLPMSIEAFFIPTDGSQSEDRNKARASHEAFLKEYKVSADDVPLIMWTTKEASTRSKDPQVAQAADPFHLWTEVEGS